MKRERCEACQRLVPLCLCDSVQPLDNEVVCLFLQHPLEVTQVKGTARLTYLSLKNAFWFVGEQVASEVVDLIRLWQSRGEKVFLLYPKLGDEVERVTVEVVAKMDLPCQIKLVILDGTWKKTRKMLFLNPILQSLPRLEVILSQPPAYFIRKQKNQLSYSTLEAVECGLSLLENQPTKYQTLLTTLKALNAQQQGFMP